MDQKGAVDEFELREIESVDERLLERLTQLRTEAWKTEVLLPSELHEEIDRFDRQGRHWIITRSNELVAAARLTLHESIEDIPYREDFVGVLFSALPASIASFNRLVVAPAVRGRGLARRLHLIRLEAARAAGCGCILGGVISGDARLRSMLKLGFEIVGTGPRIQEPPWNSFPPPTILLHRMNPELFPVELAC